MNTRLVRGNPGASSDVPRVLRRASASRAGLFLLLAGLLFPAFAQATATANDDGPIPVVRDTSRVIDVLANDTATVPLLLTIVSVDNPTAQGGNAQIIPGIPRPQIRYTPPSGYIGSDTFTYRARDGSGPPSTGTVTVVVSPPDNAPIAGTFTVTVQEDSTNNEFYGQVQANATSVDSGPIRIASATLSAGSGTVNFSDGSLRYTPDADANGTGFAQIKYTITDGGGPPLDPNGLESAAAIITVDVTAVDDTPVAGDFTATVVEDSTNNELYPQVQAGASNLLDGGAVRVASATVSSGSGSVSFSDGSLTYTPAADANGTGAAQIQYTITDGDGLGGDGAASTTATITVDVTAVDDTPVAGDFTATVIEDSSNNELYGQVVTNASNLVDVGPVRIASATVSSGSGSVSFSDGSLTYTPAADDNGAGAAQIQYTITDGDGLGGDGAASTTATITVDVTAVDDTPVAGDFTATVVEDSTNNELYGQVQANASNLLDGGSVRVASATVSSGSGSVSFSDGSLTYTPAADANGTGAAQIQYTITDGDGVGGDGAASTTATITVDVTAVDDTPVAGDFTATVVEDSSNNELYGQVVANASNLVDVGPVRIASASVSSGSGSVAFSDGSLTYTPAADANGTGTAQIQYTITDGDGLGGDGAASTTATITVNVTAVDDTPVAGDFTATVVEDSTNNELYGQVQANASNLLDGGSVRVASAAVSSGSGSVSFSDGSLTYTPAADDNGAGAAQIQYTITDGDGLGGDGAASTTATITVNVTAVDDTPVAGDFTATVVEDSSNNELYGQVQANASSLLDGGAVRIASASVSSGSGSVAFSDGSLTYTPAADANGTGTAQIQYTITDGDGLGGDGAASTTATITVDVTAVDDTPVAGDFTATVVEDSSNNELYGQVQANASNLLDGGAVRIASATVSSGSGSVSFSDGSLTYTPAADANGTGAAQIQYTITDGDGVGGDGAASTTATITVNVTAVDDTPVAGDFTATVVEDSTNNELYPQVQANASSLLDGGAVRIASATVSSGSGSVSFSDGSLTYTPAADANGAGAAQIQYTITDGDGLGGDGAASTTATITVDVTAVDDTPVAGDFTATVIEDSSNNELYGQVVTNASNLVDVGPVRIASATVSSGSGSVSFSDGSLTYTPAADDNGAGAAQIQYTITDGDGLGGNGAASTTATITVDVTAVDDTPVAGDFTATVVEDSTNNELYGQVQANASNLLDGGAVRIASASVSSGSGSVSFSDGSLTYTPAADDNGTGAAQIQYTITDGDGLGGDGAASTTATITVDVTAVDDTPVAGGFTATVVEDSTNNELYGQVVANASNLVDVGPVRIASATVSSGSGSVSFSDGSLTYTPAADDNGAGAAQIQYTITDGDGLGGNGAASTTATITVDVTAVDDTPVAGDFTATVIEDSTNNELYPQVQANASNLVDVGPVRIASATVSSGSGSVSFSDGSLTYTPAADDNGTGAAQIQYTITDGDGLGGDGAASTTATITVDVTAVDDTPVAGDFTATVIEDSSNNELYGQVVTNASNLVDVGPVRIASATVSSGSGSVSFSDGSLTYTPAADDNGAGAAQIQYTITDGDGLGGNGAASTTATITVDVTAVDDTPVAGDFTATVVEDSTNNELYGQVQANASNLLDGGAVRIASATVSSGSGSVSFSDGSLTYTPAADANGAGAAQIQYTITDGDGLGGDGAASTTATITVDVTAVDDTPVAGDFTATVIEDSSNNELYGQVVTNASNLVDVGPVRIASATVSSGSGSVSFSDGSLTYTPAADDNGTGAAQIQYTITDGDGLGGDGAASTTATITVDVTAVDDTPVAGDFAATVVEDSSNNELYGQVQANASNLLDVGPVRIASATVSSGSGSVSFSDGSLTYTPEADANGADIAEIQYTITDGDGLGGDGTPSATATIDVTVTAVVDIAVDTDSTDEDVPVTTNVLANDSFDNPARTVSGISAETNGAAVILDPALGTVEFTPAADFHGTASYAYTVTSGGATETTTVTVTVNPIDDPVAIGGDVSGTEDEDTVISGTLTADDDADGVTDGSVFSIAGSDQATNGSAVIDPASGDWDYTPNADYNGGDIFTVTVTDDEGFTATQAITLTVTPVVDIQDDSAGTSENAPVTTNVLANDNFENPGRLIQSVSTASNGTVSIVSASAGTVQYTPNADFNGADSYTYTVLSGGVTETATVTVLVGAVVNIVDDNATTNEDTAVTTNVLANDLFAGTPVVTSVTNGTNGTVTIVDGLAGTVRYTPAPDFNGSDSYTYTVTSGGVPETANVFVTVNSIDDPVVIAGDISGSGDEDTVISGTLTAADPADGLTDGSVFSIEALGTPANGGAVIDPASGLWDYTPNADYHGGDSFTVTVTDDDGFTDTQLITVTVAPVVDIADDSATTPEDTPVTTSVFDNDSFEDPARSVTSTTQGANGTVAILDAGAGTVQYTPDPDFNGTDSYDYTVTSGGGLTETATVTVTVTGVVDIADDTATTDEDTPVTTSVFANDGFAPAALVSAVSQGADGSVTIDDAGAGTLTYTPNPDFNGTDSYTYTVASGTVTETATVTVTVNAVVDIADDTESTNEDTPVTTDVLGNDSFDASAVVSAVTQGANGAVAILPGGVQYSPAPDFHGADAYTYTVTSGGVTETANVSVTVTSVDDPVLIGGDVSGTGDEDTVISGTLTADDPADGLTDGSIFSIEALAGATSGVATIDPASGLWDYTPNADYNGGDSFTVTVTDDDGFTDTQAITLTVTPVVDIADDTATTDEDTAVTTSVFANDSFEDPTRTVTLVTQGSNGVVVILDAAAGTVQYTPDPDFNGTDSYDYTVTSGGGLTETATVTVTVNAVVDIADDAATTDEDTPVTTSVLANDSFAPTALVTSVSAGADGSVTIDDASAGTLTYTPNTDFNGSDSYTYTVTSGTVTETATVTVTVNAVVDIADDTDSTNEDTPVMTDVLANDSFAPTALVTAVTQGANGSVAILPGGVEYTPVADFNGTDSYTYTVTSGGVTETATVSLTIAPVVDIADDAETTDEDVPLLTNVLANDSFDNPARTVTAVTQGANGTVVIVDGAAGTVEYTAAPDFNGTDSYTYTVTSGGVTETASVSVTITPVVDIADDTETTDEDTPVTTDVFANDSFEDPARTVTAVTQGVDGTVAIVDAAAGSIEYTPRPDFNGTDSYTYTVTSGTVTETATVTVTITPVVDIADDAETTDEDTPVTTAVLGNDSFDDPARTVTLVSAAANGTVAIVDGAAGTVLYTPFADFNGTDSYSYTVTSGGVTETATVSLTITAVVDIADDLETTDEEVPVTTNVLANDTFDDAARTVTSVTAASNGAVAILDAALGTISYTPDPQYFGADSYTYTVTSGGGITETATVSLTVVNVDDPPNFDTNTFQIFGDDFITVTEDTPLTFAALANDVQFDGAPGDPIFVASLTGGFFTAEHGTVTTDGTTITYTPDPDYFGTDAFSYFAQDSFGPAQFDNYVFVDVLPVDDAPRPVDDVATTPEDTPLTGFDPRLNDIEVDSSAGAQTPGSLVITNATVSGAAGTVTFTGSTIDFEPTPNFFGAATITYEVDDGSGFATATAEIVVTVTAVDDAPNPQNDLALTNEDTPLVDFDPRTNDSEVDSNASGAPATPGTIEIIAASADVGSAIVTNGGTTIEYTPPANFFGPAVVTYEVRDAFGTASATAIIEVSVAEVNDTPLAGADVFTVNEDDQEVVLDVLANDFLFDEPVIISIAGTTQVIGPDAFPGSTETAPTTIEDATGDPVTLPNGTVSIENDTIVYEPKTNYFGSDFFFYTLEDVDGDTHTGRVDITITGINDPPTSPIVQSFAVVQDTLLSVPASSGLLVPAFDVDGDALTVILQTDVTNGVVVLNGDGSFTYQPDLGFVGVDAFEYFVSDGTLVNAGDPRVAQIEVQPAVVVTPPPDSGVVEDVLPLAQIPLELVEGVDPNVLIIMDDSGSMDFSLATNESRAVMTLSNFGRTPRPNSRRTEAYDYLTDYPNNTYSRGGLPSESELLGSTLFGTSGNPNQYGVWRGRSSFYNKIYYNPEVRYRPWRGLAPDGDPFPQADPDRAVLNPTRPTEGFGRGVPSGNKNWDGDLRDFWRYRSLAIPEWDNNGGDEQRTNEDYYIPRYYLITEAGYDGSEPDWDTDHCLVEIRPAGDGYTNKDENAGVPICDLTAIDNGDGTFDSRGFFPRTQDRTDCSNTTFCTFTEEMQNFANWFVYYRNREYTVKAALGAVVADVTGLNVGYAVINRTSERRRIRPMEASFRGDNKSGLLDQIYRINSSGGTPLRRNLDRAGRHFQCRSGDIFGSGSNTSPGNSNCPVLPAPAGLCQQQFTLLFTDGVWNSGFNLAGSQDNEDGNADTDFDGGFFGDSNSNTLGDIAMFYYETDLHGSLSNLVPTSARDRNLAAADAFTDASNEVMHQHMTTFTVGFGVEGNLDDDDIPTELGGAITTVNWGNPDGDNFAKIDDLRHAALNGRGDYLSAADPSRLERELRAAFEEFGSGAGAASAVSFNSQQVRNDTRVFRGFYNTDDNTGDLVAQLVDFTTNTVVEEPVWSAAALLDSRTSDSRVIVTYDREPFSGSPSPNGIPFRFVDLNIEQRAVFNADQVNYLRGDRSNERPLGNFRERPGTDGLLGDIINSSPVFVGPPTFFGRDRAQFPVRTGDLYSEFLSAQQSRPGTVYVGANDGMLHAFDSQTGAERWAYIPDRIIRPGLNDANPLDELTDPTYEHLFYVDNQPAIADVFITPRGSADRSWRTVLVGSLRAGGKGLFAVDVTNPGLVTNEATAAANVMWEFTDEDDTYPVVPFSTGGVAGAPAGGSVGAILDANGRPVRDLGFTYSVPTIGMTNVQGAGGTDEFPERKWGAIFGNGYNSTYGFATLFVNFVEDANDGRWDGGDFVKIRTGFGPPPAGDPNAGLPNGLGEPRLIDLDGNGTVDYAYAGDLRGNLFRFDLTDPNPANWRSTRIFRATYSDGTPQPIISQPIVTRNTQADGVVVLVGTGSYFTTTDGTDDSIQSIYGIWDRIRANPFSAETAPPTAAGNRALLVEQDVINLFDETEGALRSLTSNEVTYEIGSVSPPVPAVRGWYIDLDPPRPTATVQGGINPDQAGNAPPAVQFPGERAVRNLDLRGGFLFVNTVIPRDNLSCDVSPGGFGLAINPLTGGAGGQFAESAFDINNDGNFDSSDLIGGNIVAGLRFDDAVPTDSTFIGTKRFTQLSDRTLDIRETNTGFGSRTGRLSWRELE